MDDAVIEGGDEVRCLRCSKFIGETDRRIELVGVVRDRDVRDVITAPRISWRCKCGWTTIYKQALARSA